MCATAACALAALAWPSWAQAQDAQGGEQASEGDQQEASAEGGGTLRRGNRMEFDARLIRGETAGSGAVFLFQRAPRALPSMVPLRKSYLDGTVDEVLGEQWEPQKGEGEETSSRRRGQTSQGAELARASSATEGARQGTSHTTKERQRRRASGDR